MGNQVVCAKDGSYYMNSNGLDEYIVDKCYNQAQQARKLHIPSPLLIANDRICKNLSINSRSPTKGKLFYTGLKGWAK
jgi:hypothetical protein